MLSGIKRSRVHQQASTVTSFSSKENVSTFMSSQAVWDTLVLLLERTLIPLAKSTYIVEDLLYGLSIASIDQRRRVGVLGPQDTIDATCQALFLPPEKSVSFLLRTIGIERSLVSNKIVAFLDGTYAPRVREHLAPDAIDVDALHSYVQDFFLLYKRFRTMVVERFEKLSKSHASRNQWGRMKSGLISDLTDNENNYALAVIRAVDKFDPSKGTLGGYVMYWISNAAGSEFSMYVGESFTLARAQRKAVYDGTLQANNRAYSLDNVVNMAGDMDGPESTMMVKELGDYMATLQSMPSLSRVLALNGTKPINNRLMNMQLTASLRSNLVDVHDNFRLPQFKADDISEISPPRKNRKRLTLDQRRRKETVDRVITHKKRLDEDYA